MTSLEVIRQRAVERILERVLTTEQWWDRDCRCCMELMWHRIPRVAATDPAHNLFDLYKERTGRKDYHIKGAGHKVVIAAGDEEVHADHTPEEITLWQEAFHNRRQA